MIKIVFTLIVAYLIVQSQALDWTVFYMKNLREHGSGNTGWPIPLSLEKSRHHHLYFWLLKGHLRHYCHFPSYQQYFSSRFGLLAVLGHTFPIFAEFKGGKARSGSQCRCHSGLLTDFLPYLLYPSFQLLVFWLVWFLFKCDSCCLCYSGCNYHVI